ncbi:hypothetical protein H2200_002743 [Cladophialophora chaetospira]|uniref:Oxidoreductase n=1 Tax=Cladophialophora chaetospira TaxID=386627 RepID=A0AA38XKD4_9EURO|nr:hypothetical protein H2200_002743 [Cladophialophora chaetospira]
MQQRPLRIALAGANGFIGRAHLQHILDEKDAELAALIDTDPSIASTATQHGVPQFPDLEVFLNAYKAGDVAADAIILATPTHTHIAMANLLLDSKLSVLIEKPLASTGKEGRQFLESSREYTNGVYMVGHHRRHNCYVRAIKDVLDKGELGRVVAVNGVWAQRKSDRYFEIPWHQQAGSGGVLLTNAIHEMDMLQYWLGEIVEVHALEGPKERPYPVDSTVQVTMKFASGTIGSFLFTE